MWAEIFSPYIIAVFLAWFGSHLVKYFTGSMGGKGVRSLFASGGMPSSHSATAMSLVTIIGLRDGTGSAVFGLAALFALIVMYDSAKVRRSAGDQGRILKELIKEQKSRVDLPYVTDGHLPLEVFFGAVFGAGVALVVYFTTLG